MQTKGEWRNWETRTTQNRVLQEVRVRFSLRPPKYVMNLDNFSSLIE